MSSNLINGCLRSVTTLFNNSSTAYLLGLRSNKHRVFSINILEVKNNNLITRSEDRRTSPEKKAGYLQQIADYNVKIYTLKLLANDGQISASSIIHNGDFSTNNVVKFEHNLNKANLASL